MAIAQHKGRLFGNELYSQATVGHKSARIFQEPRLEPLLAMVFSGVNTKAVLESKH